MGRHRKLRRVPCLGSRMFGNGRAMTIGCFREMIGIFREMIGKHRKVSAFQYEVCMRMLRGESRGRQKRKLVFIYIIKVV